MANNLYNPNSGNVGTFFYIEIKWQSISTWSHEPIFFFTIEHDKCLNWQHKSELISTLMTATVLKIVWMGHVYYGVASPQVLIRSLIRHHYNHLRTVLPWVYHLFQIWFVLFFFFIIIPFSVVSAISKYTTI